MPEMRSGLTCSGFAAITLTNSNASALLASATSAADAGETQTSGGNGESESGSLTVSEVYDGLPLWICHDGFHIAICAPVREEEEKVLTYLNLGQ